MLQLTELIGFAAGGLPKVTVNVTTNTANFNARNALISAGWDGVTPIEAWIVIASGIKLYSTAAESQTSVSSFSTGAALPLGSTMRIVNHGLIEGRGGRASQWPFSSVNGWIGGRAIVLGMDVIIDNTDGYIYGGGGGGGQCVVLDTSVTPNKAVRWAGGGGGQGNQGGKGGATGTTDTTGQTVSTNGTAGTESAPGARGQHSRDIADYGATSIYGGPGGAWGEDGGDATVSYTPGAETLLGDGGLAGKAVELNGHTVTWIGGNNSTRVKGAVS